MGVDIDKIFSEVSSSPTGLTSAEASERLRIYGYNVVEEKRESGVIDFLKRLWNPMAWLLEIAIILSFAIGHFVECLIIMALLFINAFIGFKYSRTSTKALELLKSKLRPSAKVLRDGSWGIVDVKEIVPGDVVLLEIGDIVPADGILFEGSVEVDQSMLTGESLPVEKIVGDKLFAGSAVRRGRGKMIVVATGSRTYFGRTAELVKIARPKSHQQEVMLQITKYMMLLGVAVMAVSIVYAITMNITNEALKLLVLSISILMGAVPVALPAALSIMQAVAAIEMARRGVLVTRLDAVEDASTVTVMCMDKTGTITMNKLSIVDVKPFNGLSKDEVLRLAYMATQEASTSPIEEVIRSYVESKGLRPFYTLKEFKPFTPELKRSEAFVEYNGNVIKVALGAPQVIASISSDDKDIVEAYSKALEEYSNKGYRALGVAFGYDKLRIAGLIFLADPPRPESPSLIKKLKELGLKIVMITGDNKLIAEEVARSVGIGNRVYSINEVKVDGDLADSIIDADAVAEVLPEDKYYIVKKFQEKGHRVGMTGDGVNDAPALKQAELGIAVSNASDVAKSAASVVLTKPGLEGIVDIIYTSRSVYQRALSWMVNKVSKTIQFTLLAALTFLWIRQDVITLMGMVLLIFSNDFATMSLATDNVRPLPRPGKPNVKSIVLASSIIGVWLVIFGAIALYIGRYIFNYNVGELQTYMLLIMVFTSQFRILIVRERESFYSSRPGRELFLSVIGVLATFIILGAFGAIITPIPLEGVIFALLYSAVTTFSADPIKILAFKRFGIGL